MCCERVRWLARPQDYYVLPSWGFLSELIRSATICVQASILWRSHFLNIVFCCLKIRLGNVVDLHRDERLKLIFFALNYKIREAKEADTTVCTHSDFRSPNIMFLLVDGPDVKEWTSANTLKTPAALTGSFKMKNNNRQIKQLNREHMGNSMFHSAFKD